MQISFVCTLISTTFTPAMFLFLTLVEVSTDVQTLKRSRVITNKHENRKILRDIRTDLTSNFSGIYTSGESWSGSQVVRKCSIIKSPNNSTKMLRYFNNDNNNMHLLCYIVKYVFYIPPKVVWQVVKSTASQTGSFTTDTYYICYCNIYNKCYHLQVILCVVTLASNDEPPLQILFTVASVYGIKHYVLNHDTKQDYSMYVTNAILLLLYEITMELQFSFYITFVQGDVKVYSACKCQV
jgi:hypothetical protein